MPTPLTNHWLFTEKCENPGHVTTVCTKPFHGKGLGLKLRFPPENAEGHVLNREVPLYGGPDEFFVLKLCSTMFCLFLRKPIYRLDQPIR